MTSLARPRRVVSHLPGTLVALVAATPSLDTSGLDAVVQLHRTLKRQGQGLVLANVNEQPLSLIRRGWFESELGADAIVPTVASAFDDLPLAAPAAPA